MISVFACSTTMHLCRKLELAAMVTMHLEFIGMIYPTRLLLIHLLMNAYDFVLNIHLD